MPARPRCSTQRFWQHPRGCLELHKPPQGLSTASLFRWALGEVFPWFSLDCKRFLFPNREGSASQRPLCNGALFRCLRVPDTCQRLQEKTRSLQPLDGASWLIIMVQGLANTPGVPKPGRAPWGHQHLLLGDESEETRSGMLRRQTPPNTAHRLPTSGAPLRTILAK